MTIRQVFDSSSASFIDYEDIAFSAPTVDHGVLATRVVSGAIRHTSGQEEAATIAHASHAEPITGQAGNSVASTLQARYGAPSVELVPGAPSSRTSVEVAASMGLIRRDEAGQWVDSGTADQQAQALHQELQPEPQQQDQQGNQQDLREVLDLEAFESYASAIEPLPQAAVDVAQAHAMAAVFEGQTLSQVAAAVGHRLATESGLGLEPSQGAEVVQQGVQFYEGTVARVAALEGIDASMKEGFYEALRTGTQAGLQDALVKLVHGGDVSGFRELARAYAAATPSPTVQMLQEGGFEVARTADGWMARRGAGQWVPVAELTKHAAAGAPAAPAPVSPARTPTKAPAGKTKLYFNPATLECDLTEAEAIRDGVNMKHFAWL